VLSQSVVVLGDLLESELEVDVEEEDEEEDEVENSSCYRVLPRQPLVEVLQ
jgi:hypothetical protein